ncbi:putative membrane protein [Asticcacaulis biprosthecium C19]|uniref:Putative membrane protein n=2 Tax=Asticcacaulis biprosthecium TaxID=76891 RepID=F4QTS5_9CAUL|nr:putative membrane protein [Asticcacaulis biprosthecium C19]
MSFWMALYISAIVFNGFYFRGSLGPVEVPLSYVLAVLPSLPVGGMIWVMLRHIETSDEYVRGQLVRRYLIAMGLTLLLCSAYTFLENYTGVKIFERLYVFAVFCACLAVVTPFTLGATRNPS